MDPSSIMQQYGTAVMELSPRQMCQSFFFIAASVVLFLNSIPAFRLRFISYGSRSSQPDAARANDKTTNKGKSTDTLPERKEAGNPISQFLDYLASFQVPHSWFTHFYVVSVCSSVFWAIQIFLRGRFFEALASREAAQVGGAQNVLTINQVFIAWLFMTIQGTRRLYESFAFGKPSKSRMWCVHWILGLMYYSAMGISVWIEGSTTLLNTEVTRQSLSFLGTPSIKNIIGIPLFIFASGIQHDHHFYLSTLKKYTLPNELFFGMIICPHYTMECLIYVALAIVAAPEGHAINKTIFSGLIFVAVNLGVTAQITKEWYAEKFGKEKVEKKWVMIPPVY